MNLFFDFSCVRARYVTFNVFCLCATTSCQLLVVSLLQQIKRSVIRKGMVMVSPLLDPQACWDFEAELLVLHHPTTISVKYQAMGM